MDVHEGAPTHYTRQHVSPTVSADSAGTAAGEAVVNELYNHTADPDENVNVANDTALAPVVAALSAQLRAGWRALPATRYE